MQRIFLNQTRRDGGMRRGFRNTLGGAASIARATVKRNGYPGVLRLSVLAPEKFRVNLVQARWQFLERNNQVHVFSQAGSVRVIAIGSERDYWIIR